MTDTTTRTPPPHPVTLTTNEDGAQERNWSCPPCCPTPRQCQIFQDLNVGAYGIFFENLPDGPYAAGLDWIGHTVTHPDGTDIMIPSFEAEATRYTVSPLHENDPDRHMFAVTVSQRRDGNWVVWYGEGTYLGDDGTWSDGVGPGQEWADTHLFDLDHALELAQAAAPRITVNGTTALEAWKRADNARRLKQALDGATLPARWQPRHTRTALEVLAALAPQMSREAAAAWMTEPRYPNAAGQYTALQEIDADRGHLVLDNARSRAED